MDVESHVSKAPAADGLADKIAKTLEEIKNNLEKTQNHMKVQVDKKYSEALAYAVRDLVWLSTDNLCLLCTSKKLSEHWLSPYKITKPVGSNTVELLLPKSMQIHLVINISLVKPYKEHLPHQPANQPSPSHVTDDWNKEYEVDYIVNSHWKGCRLEYLIHCKGYDDSKCMWKPLSNLSHAKEMISNFIHAHSNTLHYLNMAYLDFVCLFLQYDSSTDYDGHNAPFDHLEVDL